MKVACPKCAVEFVYSESRWRPFCSERCKLIDLGKWLDESYSTPVEESDTRPGESDVPEKSSVD